MALIKRKACQGYRVVFTTAFLMVVALGAMTVRSGAADHVDEIQINWSKVERVSKTTATLQVVVNPLLRKDSPIHDQAFQALRDLRSDDVRYVPWYPYPKLGVAELQPPTADKTSWDFSLIDPLTLDFLNATTPHSVVLNFSTIPQWMFKTDRPVAYPADQIKPHGITSREVSCVIPA